MMMDQNTGKYLAWAGAMLLIVGLVIYFLGPKLPPFGRLPGDIRVERGNFRFYAPIMTMIIVSLVLTLLINVIKRFF